jgi:hypothetical protein
MSPETFHDLLDRATQTAPPAPLPRAAVTAGHGRLRRRRLGAASGTAALALSVGGLWAVLPDGTPDAGRDPGIARSVKDAQILDTCLDSGRGRPAEAALLASGQPTLEASARTDVKIQAAISSADGSLWASCWIWQLPQAGGELTAGMDVFEAVQSSDGGPAGGFAFGTGCSVPETQQHGCDTWSLSLVDRLPAAVAAVRYDLGDGTTVTVPTYSGYVVLNVQHPVPPGGRVSHQGDIVGFNFGRKMTYLAADGTPLAAGRLDRMGNNDVAGLAPLSDYSSIGRVWEP